MVFLCAGTSLTEAWVLYYVSGHTSAPGDHIPSCCVICVTCHSRPLTIAPPFSSPRWIQSLMVLDDIYYLLHTRHQLTQQAARRSIYCTCHKCDFTTQRAIQMLNTSTKKPQHVLAVRHLAWDIDCPQTSEQQILAGAYECLSSGCCFSLFFRRPIELVAPRNAHARAAIADLLLHAAVIPCMKHAWWARIALGTCGLRML